MPQTRRNPVYYGGNGCIDRGGDTGNTGISKADRHYETISADMLCDLPVATADDCLLFLWAVSPELPTALQVGNSMGFRLYHSSVCMG